MHLQRGGRRLDLPVYVAAPTTADPVGTGLKLDLCPFEASSVAAAPAGRLEIAALVVSLSGLDAPKTPGLYRWRAIVAPLSEDGTRALADRGYELQALVAVPHVLALRSRYDAVHRRAVLTGTLRMRGKPRPRAIVTLTQLDRTITAHGPRFLDAPVAATRTSRSGVYTVVVPLPATRGFVASTPAIGMKCTVPAAAPTGCKRATLAGTESQPITV